MGWSIRICKIFGTIGLVGVCYPSKAYGIEPRIVTKLLNVYRLLLPPQKKKNRKFVVNMEDWLRALFNC